MTVLRGALLVLLVGAAPAQAAAQPPLSPLTWPVDQRPIADWVSTGLVLGQLTANAIAHREGWRCFALENGVTIGAAELTKRLVPETRPDGSDHKSFYSEHSALAMVNRGWHAQLGISVALGAGYLRVGAAKHHVWDVGVGLLVGQLADRLCH